MTLIQKIKFFAGLQTLLKEISNCITQNAHTIDEVREIFEEFKKLLERLKNVVPEAKSVIDTIIELVKKAIQS